jgi:predicted ribosome quality control (RQC) complex YloA/Tae2 family protein
VLSFVELRRAAAAVDARFAGFRVERIAQPDAFQLVLACYGRDAGAERGVKRFLLLSCDPRFARVAELEMGRPSAERPPAFLQFVRPRLEGARLRSARLAGRERQLSLIFDSGEGSFELLLSLLGKRSNCYVLDAERRLLAAQRALDKTRRSLRIGEPWEDPPEGTLREGEDRFEAVPRGELLAAITAQYSGSEEERDADDLGTRLAKALRKERKAAERRAARIEGELAEAEQASELQRHGELLKGALGRVEPGMDAIIVRDHATDEDVEIPLDPSLSARDNLEATFKRYQKLVRRLTKAGGQADEAHAVLERLDALEQALERAREQGPDEIATLARRDDAARLLRKHAGAKAAEGTLPASRPRKGPLEGVPRRLQPRRYRSADGLEIWVGRSDEGNDHLSTRLARGRDLFFHLDGAPGSHVVLRTEGRPDPPSESVIDACELAVHFSKSKNAGRADVHVVPIKNVKKPRGAKRGLVYVTGGRTVHLRREQARLERLLASRIED